MSWSCPFHSFQLPLHVPGMFSVCPCHFPCMSRSFVASNFPTSPVVLIGFISLCFPVIPPALPSFSFLSLSCPFQFPFVSFISSCFPDMWTSYFLLSFPCTSLLFPFAPQYFPQKNTVFPAFSQREHPKAQSVSRFSAKASRKPKPAKNRGTPVLRHRLPEDYV